jgi:hypothetical protein
MRALEEAGGGDRFVSVGSVFVNGHQEANMFQYRLTDKRLVWNSKANPEVAGFALGDVSVFGAWENDRGHTVVGVDVHGALWDLLLIPAAARVRGEAGDHQRQLIVRYFVHALRDAGARELTPS